MPIPIGVANSVSSNFAYDPLDAMHYAMQSEFEILQIYLTEDFLNQKSKANRLRDEIKKAQFSTIYFHADGLLNNEFFNKEYLNKLFDFLTPFNCSRMILHFDEAAALEDSLKMIDVLSGRNIVIYLENYFRKKGRENAEKNLRKYLALFTLANSQSVHVFPVLDIPRFFHRNLQMDSDKAIQWCYQIFNYFGNKHTASLLHLIDTRDPHQDHRSFCPIGEGYIPYRKIFGFMQKTQTPVEGIILEYEDKISPLKSRENLYSLLFPEQH